MIGRNPYVSSPSIECRSVRLGNVRQPCALVIILGLTCATVEAQTVYFESPDEPVDLPDGSAVTFHPWAIVRNDSGSYSVAVSADGTELSIEEHPYLDAVHQLTPGSWLLSVQDTMPLGPIPPGSVSRPFWDRRDVFVWTPQDEINPFSAYPPYEGAMTFIPVGRNVDAAFVDPTGAVVISFDEDTMIGSIMYEKGDLVRYASGSFDAVPYFDASMAGIPNSKNVIAATRKGLLTVFSLDEGTDVATLEGTYSVGKGELISWDGRNLAVFDQQPGWPDNQSGAVNALTFDATSLATSPGDIGPSLMVERQDGNSLRLSWAASDCAGARNAAVYQGTLLSPFAYNHEPITCNDAFPFFEEVVPLPDGNAYFLVVARTDFPAGAGEEGSYGFRTIPGPRPRASRNNVCPKSSAGLPVRTRRRVARR